MAQSDYTIANAPGAVVRGDINDNLQAIVTLNSGSGAPADTFPYMFWVDTATGKIKQRNSANTAWIEIGDVNTDFWNLLQRIRETGGPTILSLGSIPDGFPVVRVGSNLIGQGVRRIRESGGADLPMGSVPDGNFLKRVGSQIIGTESIGVIATNFQSLVKDLFGDGSDGDVTISTNTTLAAGTGGVRVMQYNNLTINTGIWLTGNTADRVLAILVKGKLTLNGQILMNGRGALGGAGVVGTGVGLGGGAGAIGAGAGGSSGAIIGGGGGGGGAPGLNGSTGGNSGATDQWQLGGHSRGKGGDGVDGQAGGSGLNYIGSMNSPFIFEILKRFFGAGGGSGGNSSPGGLSGVGGSGGGVIWVEANEIEWGASGIISANGINGSGTTSARGGGGGGGGGAAQVVYKTKTGTSVITASGGTGGASGGGFGDHAGGSGAAGLSGEFQVG